MKTATVLVSMDTRLTWDGKPRLSFPGYPGCAFTDEEHHLKIRQLASHYAKSFQLSETATIAVQVNEMLEHGRTLIFPDSSPWRALVCELIENGVRLGFDECKNLLFPAVLEPTMENFDPCI